MASTAELDILLAASPDRLRRWSDARRLMTGGAATAFANLQTVASANGLVVSADPLIHRMAELASTLISQKADITVALLHIELASVVASPWFGSSGSFTTDVVVGLTARFRTWATELEGSTTVNHASVVPLQPGSSREWQPVTSSAVAYVAAAALDHYMAEQQQDDYRYKLERIRMILGLKPGEVTRLIGVSHQGLRKWEAGSPISSERFPLIDSLLTLALLFADHIRPEGIQSFIRRRVRALDNRTPLEWLLSGRHEELKRLYEEAFSWEITA